MQVTAFHKWLRQESGGNRVECALILHYTLMKNPASDNQVWELLKGTGCKKYDGDAFLKAADIALELTKKAG